MPIIVTAYEQTHTLPVVVESILAVNYSNYLIYIVADNCDISQLHFTDERVIVLRPEQVLRGNVKSHFYAINRFRRPHTHLTIIDSDNLMDAAYLKELDKFFDQGFSAVQGVRKPKNLDTTIACLDAARDIYYIFMMGRYFLRWVLQQRWLARAWLLPLRFTKSAWRILMYLAPVLTKFCNMPFCKKNYRIAFAHDAVVFDEKNIPQPTNL